MPDRMAFSTDNGHLPSTWNAVVGCIAVVHLPWDLVPLAPRPVSASELALPSWSSESIRTGQLLTPSNWGLIVRPSRAPDKLRSFSARCCLLYTSPSPRDRTRS